MKIEYGYPEAANCILQDVEPGREIKVSLDDRYGSAIEQLLSDRGLSNITDTVAALNAGIVLTRDRRAALEFHRTSSGWSEIDQRAALAYYVINSTEIDGVRSPLTSR